ncbi:MAG: flavodoxin family protein [Thermoplasmatales archaeon]|nr:flavodoxin family protein [Thermoplasmatales archaeon]
MKATLIVGSGRMGGNTEIQCEAVADALAEDGFEVEIIKPYWMDIEHCSSCDRCFSEGRCHIDDDMGIIYDAFDSSELIVLGSPVYFSGPSSIIKQVIDRFQLFWHRNQEERTGKTIALVSSGGSSNPRFESIISICRAFALTLNAKWGGECLVENTDVWDTSNVAKEAYRFGKILSGKVKKKF